MMHSPCFRFPPVSEKFVRLRDKFPQFYLFPKTSDFHPPNFLMTFFSHQPQISNSPLLSLFQYISSTISRKLFFPPTFQNFPSVFVKFTCFTYFMCFSFPP